MKQQEKINNTADSGKIMKNKEKLISYTLDDIIDMCPSKKKVKEFLKEKIEEINEESDELEF